MLWDMHMHSCFSSDSEAQPEKMIQKAKEIGLTGIYFTDHMDYDYSKTEDIFTFDVKKYFEALTPLKSNYDDHLKICIGLELGLQPHLAKRHQTLLTAHPFDFVIGSSHLVNGEDPYYKEYFENKAEDDAYLDYFISIKENILAFDGFDVYGHLDYIVRYGPNKNKYYSYFKFKDIIDEILKLLIERGKGIEINTGGFKYGLAHPNPTQDIIKRYKELGGEIITIGSDAHTPEHIGYDFNKLPAILKEAGFDYYTIFTNRQPTFIKIV